MAICATASAWLQAEADAAMESPRPVARACLLERRNQVHLGGLEGRRQPEEHACGHREAHRQRQHMPVQRGVQGEVFLAVGQQQGQRADAPFRDHHAERAAQHPKRHRFGEQLPHYAHAAGAQAEPEGHFSAARRGARQQQVGDIGAGNRQDQSHQGHQHVQGLGILAPQEIQAAGALLEDQQREVGVFARVDGGAVREVAEQGNHGRFGALARDAGPQPGHHLNPVIGVCGEFGPRIPGPEDGLQQNAGMHRHIYVLRSRRVDAEELRRRDARDGEGIAVDESRLSMPVCMPSSPSLRVMAANPSCMVMP